VPQEKDIYVEKVLKLYRRLQDTRSRPRRADRTLAGQLHRRGVDLDVVEIALRLATARRRTRPSDAEPLPPIRSLHYFLPVINELSAESPPEGYLEYLRHALRDESKEVGLVTPPKDRRPTLASKRSHRQLRLPLELGAGPKKDVSS